METQVCKRCRKKKPLAKFYKAAFMKNAHESQCKVCQKELLRERKQRNPKKYQDDLRRNRYLRWYGITIEDYDQMFEIQKGKCAICGTTRPHFRKNVKHFNVDHNHETGTVRGLLCNTCNRGLGLFRDNVGLIGKAFQYLTNN